MPAQQGSQETLQEYIQRFTRTTLEVPIATPEILVNAFSQGLQERDFFRPLIKRPPSDFDDLLGWEEKYINVEEAQRVKRSKPSK